MNKGKGASEEEDGEKSGRWKSMKNTHEKAIMKSITTYTAIFLV